ncbi:MAG: hypothetical protein AAB658_21255, partial [Chloroflexota bacterium]
FRERYGVNAGAIAAYPMYRGVAALVGMTVMGTPKNFEEEVALLERKYAEHDFFFVHFKGTDAAGHTGDFAEKVRQLEIVDAMMPRLEALKPEVVWQIADGREAWPGAESPLRHLEAQLFEPAISTQNVQSFGGVYPERSRRAQGESPITNNQSPITNNQPPITFLQAQTRAAEARAALRWIKQQIVEAGAPIGETAIFARALDPYRPFLEETAREFGLPLRLVGGSPLAESPVVSALLALLSLPVVHPWRPRGLLAAWRSPYFDWPALSIDPTHAATLDAVSRLGRVVEGLDQWREALARHSQPPAETLDDEPENVAPSLPVEAVAAARAAFEKLATRLTPPARASLRDYVAFVEDLIGDDPTLPAPRFGQPKAGPDSLNIVARAVAASDLSTAARDLAAL